MEGSSPSAASSVPSSLDRAKKLFDRVQSKLQHAPKASQNNDGAASAHTDGLIVSFLCVSDDDTWSLADVAASNSGEMPFGVVLTCHLPEQGSGTTMSIVDVGELTLSQLVREHTSISTTVNQLLDVGMQLGTLRSGISISAESTNWHSRNEADSLRCIINTVNVLETRWKAVRTTLEEKFNYTVSCNLPTVLTELTRRMTATEEREAIPPRMLPPDNSPVSMDRVRELLMEYGPRLRAIETARGREKVNLQKRTGIRAIENSGRGSSGSMRYEKVGSGPVLAVNISGQPREVVPPEDYAEKYMEVVREDREASSKASVQATATSDIPSGDNDGVPIWVVLPLVRSGASNAAREHSHAERVWTRTGSVLAEVSATSSINILPQQQSPSSRPADASEAPRVPALDENEGFAAPQVQTAQLKDHRSFGTPNSLTPTPSSLATPSSVLGSKTNPDTPLSAIDVDMEGSEEEHEEQQLESIKEAPAETPEAKSDAGNDNMPATPLGESDEALINTLYWKLWKTALETLEDSGAQSPAAAAFREWRASHPSPSTAMDDVPQWAQQPLRAAVTSLINCIPTRRSKGSPAFPVPKMSAAPTSASGSHASTAEGENPVVLWQSSKASMPPFSQASTAAPATTSSTVTSSPVQAAVDPPKPVLSPSPRSSPRDQFEDIDMDLDEDDITMDAFDDVDVFASTKRNRNRESTISSGMVEWIVSRGGAERKTDVDDEKDPEED